MSILEIFRAGTRPDSNGVERTFTNAELDQIASSYNPAVYRAPIVEGHDESKNRGLIGQVRRIGNSLLAVPSSVDAAFKEQVNQGKFPSISVGLYAPQDKKNPTPGKWALRHVGFPQIPAVKGMLQPQFGEAEGEIVIQFSEWNNGFVDLEPPKTIEQSPIEEPIMPVENAETTAELERLRTEVAELKKQQQENQFSEFLDKLGGKVTPGEKPAYIALMSNLAGTGEVAFSEAGATKNQSPLEIFKKSLENREVKISLTAAPEAIDFAESPEAVAKEAQKLQREQKAAGNEISFSEAVAQIQKGGN
ncbi:MAG: hypothetical protein DDT31_00206 [Syntrophomonadaceae bacterium]|nr:hypothetical protein [Bacillota bacterium]